MAEFFSEIFSGSAFHLAFQGWRDGRVGSRHLALVWDGVSRALPAVGVIGRMAHTERVEGEDAPACDDSLEVQLEFFSRPLVLEGLG